MKIGFDAKRAFLNQRGLGNYSRTIIHGINNYFPDSELFLYTPKLTSEARGQYPHLFNNKNSIILPQGIWSKLSSVWRRRKITSLIQEDNLNVYHGLSHELPVGIEKFNGLKVVTIHDLQYLKHPEFFPLIDRKVYDMKVRHACKVADRIVTICDHTKKDLIEYLNIDEKKCITHYQSCAEDFFPENHNYRESSVNEKPFILNVGAFVPNKNQITLIKAFAELADLYPHDLVLIGAGKDKRYFEDITSIISQTGLHQRIKIIENVSQKDLVDYYLAADLFCFPSFYEGFGIPIIEAMFCKTPVISSHTSSMPEVGGAAIEYFDPSSVEELTSKINSTLSNDKKINKMIEQGEIQAQKFHLKTSMEKLFEIYKS